MQTMSAISKKLSFPQTKAITKELLSSLRKMIYPLTKGSNDTDDILQEVLIKVHKKGAAVEPSKFLAWLHQVSRTTAIDYYRKNKARLSLKNQHLMEPSFEVGDDHYTVEKLAKCVRPLLKNLESEDQRILSAVDLDGTSQEDVAKKEGVKYSTLKSKVQRARQKLKDEILNCCQVELDSRKSPLAVKSKKKSSCC